MDFDKELKALYMDKKIKSIAVNIAGHYADDLYQDSLLILMEYNKDKVKEAVNGGYLKNIFVRIMYNQFNYKNAKFHNIHRKNAHLSVESFYDDIVNSIPNQESGINEEEQEQAVTFIQAKIATQTSENDSFNKELFKLYMELGSLRAVQKQTGINYQSINRAIKAFKQEAIDEYNTTFNRDNGTRNNFGSAYSFC